MQIVINAGDAVRVTAHDTIMGSPLLLLWVNDRPVGHISDVQAAELRKVVKDPSKIQG